MRPVAMIWRTSFGVITQSVPLTEFAAASSAREESGKAARAPFS